MPKMKTHSSSKKRLKVTGSGKVKRNVANRAHKLTGKSSKQKRSLKQSAYVDSTSKNAVKKLLPYMNDNCMLYMSYKYGDYSGDRNDRFFVIVSMNGKTI